MIKQRTIQKSVQTSGVGLHNGEKVTMTLKPAEVDQGIVFRRVDQKKNHEVKISPDAVKDTKMCSAIGEDTSRVATVEHLMSALSATGIDNIIIELNGSEVPIMDGSSEPFIFLIECAGIKVQEAPRQIIEITKKFRVEDGDKFIEVEPAKEFAVDFHIDFNHQHVPQQKFNYHSTFASFKNDVCMARTFGFKNEIEYLNKNGLAKGGSLDNAIVIGDDGIVNEGGLRYENEFARHKTLDFIGDIYLAGHYIVGHFNVSKSGHGLNNKMLHQLFADETAWKLV